LAITAAAAACALLFLSELMLDRLAADISRCRSFRSQAFENAFEFRHSECRSENGLQKIWIALNR